MRYYRCQCEKRAAWSSMGVADCDGCRECNTTLEEYPDMHRAPAEHDWEERWTIDPVTGVRGRERFCFRCMKKETLRIEAS